VAWLLLREPDFGAFVVVAVTAFGVLFLGGMSGKHFAALVAMLGAGFAVLVLSSPYRMQRIFGFMDPWSDAYGRGYQLSHALIAFGRGEFERLGLPRPKLHVVGGETSLPDDFDRVLVDAPCSGTGTLRHRPEITLRLGPDDPGRLAELALTITLEAAARLRPGGTLLFVVCSVLERECEQVARELIRRSPNLRPEAFPPSEFQRLVPDGAAQFRLLPDVHGTDGYFLAHFRKHPAVLTTAPRSLS
jgi:hypothetical protein